MIKAWGTSERLVSGPTFEAHRIEAHKGGYSSLHKHIHKHNMIRVESGALKVSTEHQEHILRAGEFITIPPDALHRFVAVEDTVAYEFYWVKIDGDDIVRMDTGGIK